MNELKDSNKDIEKRKNITPGGKKHDEEEGMAIEALFNDKIRRILKITIFY